MAIPSPSDFGVKKKRRTATLAGRDAALDPHLAALNDNLATADAATLLRLVAELFESRNLPLPWLGPMAWTVKRFADDWFRRRSPKVSEGHRLILARALHSFCKLHGDLALDSITADQAQSWADGLNNGKRTERTIKNLVCGVSSMFQRALLLGLVKANPCAVLELMESEGVEKLPISDEDFLKLTAYLQKTGQWEWHLLSLLMRYSKLRLMDAATLPTSAVVIVGEATFLRTVSSKTRRHRSKIVDVPVFDPLAKHLRACVLWEGQVCRELSKMSKDKLSKQFRRHLELAGIDRQTVTLASGRKCDRITAHSLRHAFIQDMVKRGVPQELRMKLADHSTANAHRGYEQPDGLLLHRQVQEFFSRNVPVSVVAQNPV